MIVRTDNGEVKAMVATAADECDVCRGKVTHWTAEIGPDALYLLTWCDKCWSTMVEQSQHRHPHEVDRDAWLTFQAMALEIHEF